jgi:ATP-dependent helicase/nuclease subunit A
MAGLVAGYAGSETERRVAAAAHVRREHTFSFPLGTTMLTGVVDVLAIEEDGHALVVDYKSDRLEGADPVAFCDEHYGTQRLVYALAALKSGASRVDVVHSFLEVPDEPVSATFSADDASALETRLVELAGGVIAGRFEPTDDPHRELCATCPGRPALCCWDESRTLAPKLS